MVANRLTLTGAVPDVRDKTALQNAISSLNGGTGKLQLSYQPSDLDFRTNIENIYTSINSGYPARLQLSGSVKNLTLRTNLTNLINRHNEIVAERKLQ